MADLDQVARAKARHARNQYGECDECSQGYEYGGAGWPCRTWLDLETPAELAEREATEAVAAKASRAAEHVATYRKALSEQRSAYKRASKLDGDLDAAVVALLAEVDGDVGAAAGLLEAAVEDVRRRARLETDAGLHARFAHPRWDADA